MLAILDFILSFFIKILSYIIDLLNSVVFDTMGVGLDNERTLSKFFEAFPMAEGALDIITKLGYSVIFMILLWNLFKGLFGPLNEETENPFRIVAKSIIATVFVYGAPALVHLIFQIGTAPFQMVQALETVDNAGLVGGFGGVELASGISAFVGSSLITGAGPLLGSIVIFLSATLLIALIFGYIKLIIEYIERYVVLSIMSIMAPLVLATYGSKTTSNILKAWVRAMFSNVILMSLNVFFLKVFVSGMRNMALFSIDSNVLLTTLFLLAWVRTGQRADELLQTLGITTVQTGQGLGMELFAAGRIANSGMAPLNNQLQNKVAGREVANQRTLGGFIGNQTGGMISGKALPQNRARLAESLLDNEKKNVGGIFATTQKQYAKDQATAAKLGDTAFSSKDLEKMVASGKTYSGEALGKSLAKHMGGGLENANVVDGQIMNGTMNIKTKNNPDSPYATNHTFTKMTPENAEAGDSRTFTDKSGQEWRYTPNGDDAHQILTGAKNPIPEVAKGPEEIANALGIDPTTNQHDIEQGSLLNLDDLNNPDKLQPGDKIMTPEGKAIQLGASSFDESGKLKRFDGLSHNLDANGTMVENALGGLQPLGINPEDATTPQLLKVSPGSELGSAVMDEQGKLHKIDPSTPYPHLNKEGELAVPVINPETGATSSLPINQLKDYQPETNGFQTSSYPVPSASADGNLNEVSSYFKEAEDPFKPDGVFLKTNKGEMLRATEGSYSQEGNVARYAADGTKERDYTEMNGIRKTTAFTREDYAKVMDEQGNIRYEQLSYEHLQKTNQDHNVLGYEQFYSQGGLPVDAKGQLDLTNVESLTKTSTGYAATLQDGSRVGMHFTNLVESNSAEAFSQDNNAYLQTGNNRSFWTEYQGDTTLDSFITNGSTKQYYEGDHRGNSKGDSNIKHIEESFKLNGIYEKYGLGPNTLISATFDTETKQALLEFEKHSKEFIDGKETDKTYRYAVEVGMRKNFEITDAAQVNYGSVNNQEALWALREVKEVDKGPFNTWEVKTVKDKTFKSPMKQRTYATAVRARKGIGAMINRLGRSKNK